MDFNLKNFPDEYLVLPNLQNAGFLFVARKTDKKGFKISVDDLRTLIGISAVNGEPIITPTTNQLPSVNNDGGALEKGNWIVLTPNSWTNISGGAAVVVPASNIGISFFNGTIWGAPKLIPLTVNTILNGSGAPAAGLGNIGDFYIDYTNIRLYGAKTSSGWGAGVSLKGTSGSLFLNQWVTPYLNPDTGVNGYSINQVVRDENFNEYVSLSNNNTAALSDVSKWRKQTPENKILDFFLSIDSTNKEELTEFEWALGKLNTNGSFASDANYFVTKYYRIGYGDILEIFRAWTGHNIPLAYFYEDGEEITPVESVFPVVTNSTTGGTLVENLKHVFQKTGWLVICLYKNAAANGTHPENDFNVKLTRLGASYGKAITTFDINKITDIGGVTSFKTFLEYINPDTNFNDSIFYKAIDFWGARPANGYITANGIFNTSSNQYHRYSEYISIPSGKTVYVYGCGDSSGSIISLYAEQSEVSFIKSQTGTGANTNNTYFKWYKLTNDSGSDAFIRIWSRIWSNDTDTRDKMWQKVIFFFSDNENIKMSLNFKESYFNLTDNSAGKKNTSLNFESNYFGKIIGHRGYTGFGASENTKDAYYHSYLLGVKIVECDVNTTLDGVPVLMHDSTINRTMSNVDGSPIPTAINVNSITFADLKSNYIYKNSKGIKRSIYSFEEFLQDCQRWDLVPFIELKDNTLPIEQLKQLNDLIAKYLDFRRAKIGSFNTANCYNFRSINPFIDVYLISGSMPSKANLDRMETERIDACLGAGIADNQANLDLLRSKGIKFQLWTVNSAVQFVSSYRAKADYISTDVFADFNNKVGRSVVKYNSLFTFGAYVLGSGAIIESGYILANNGATVTTPNITNASGFGVQYIEFEAKGNFTLSYKGGEYNHSSAGFEYIRFAIPVNTGGDFTVQLKSNANGGAINMFNFEYRSF